MCRSLLEAVIHTWGCVVFGCPLIEQPLMRRQLIELLVEVEGRAALAFETAADALVNWGAISVEGE